MLGTPYSASDWAVWQQLIVHLTQQRLKVAVIQDLYRLINIGLMSGFMFGLPLSAVS